MRRPRVGPRWSGRVSAVAALVASSGVFAVVNDTPAAYADASAPPNFSTLSCPAATYPAADAAPDAPFQAYGVPFRTIIFDGDLKLPPNVDIPHIYASACGLVALPQLSATITSSSIVLATPNIYIAGLEALPASVKFGGLDATINLTPATNGGLDISLKGTTQASVTTLGFTCGITLDASFTTQTDGSLSGQPVTGPTMQGQAIAVGNSFAVPAVVGSDTGTCPPSVAQTFNKLLGLPAASGVGQFTAPFCFDFELESTALPVKTANCPWPAQ